MLLLGRRGWFRRLVLRSLLSTQSHEFGRFLRECNKTIVEEFYGNGIAFANGDYMSYVRGVYVSYSPDVIDSTFGFRPEGQCGVQTRRASWREGAITDTEYDQIREALAMPGKDWRYSRQGARQRLQDTDMLPLAKSWAKWWIHNFEACSNETEIITSRCLGVYSILMGEPIQVGRVIAQSIRRMITSSEATIGHPFVISHLCSIAGVPEEDDDDIIGPEIPLGARFLSRAQRDLERAQQGQQQQQQPPQQQQVHQPPPQHHQFSEYELGMAATQYDMHQGYPHDGRCSELQSTASSAVLPPAISGAAGFDATLQQADPEHAAASAAGSG
ncbi:hypothetical protein QL285_088512 [Trifolium repens]|nr:hypothetical protein QL285_088512 [Trifolium repens]